MESMVSQNAVMQELKALGILEMNKGVSTGLNWLEGKGDKVDSYSPVDGQLIASTTSASREEYETIMERGV